jgi:lipase chaperone LimK
MRETLAANMQIIDSLSTQLMQRDTWIEELQQRVVDRDTLEAKNLETQEKLAQMETLLNKAVKDFESLKVKALHRQLLPFTKLLIRTKAGR